MNRAMRPVHARSATSDHPEVPWIGAEAADAADTERIAAVGERNSDEPHLITPKIHPWMRRVASSAGLNACVCLFIVSLCLGLIPLFGQTDMPPVLVGMSITPAMVNVTSSSATVTISLTLTNNLSGVDFDAPDYIYDELTLVSPSGKQVISITNIGSSPFTLVSGTPLDGVWQATLTIPEFSESGQWTVTSITVPDAAGNELGLNTSQLTTLGFPTTLGVISNPDTTPPTLMGITLNPSSIDVTSSSQQVTLTLNLADSPAGVVFPGGNQLGFAFRLTSPSGNQNQWLATTQFTLVSGTPQSGTWQATLTIPQYSEVGRWTVGELLLQDAANNSENFDETTLAALGFSPSLQVSDNSPDTTPPTLTNLTFSPRFLDTSSGSQTVTVTLQATDDLSGVSFAGTTPALTFFYGPNFRSPSTSGITLFSFCTQTAGTPLNGTWQCGITIPPFSAAGAWTLGSVTLKDAATNEISYNTATCSL